METNIEKYLTIARKEIIKPAFWTTKQYLEVHEVEYENWLPKVARVSLDYYEDVIAVYFKVKDEDFFIDVHITKGKNPELQGVWTESGHRVYLSITSKEISFRELEKLLPFKATKAWIHRNKHNFVFFEPITNRAYWLDEKLELLLNDLESKSNELKELTKNANGQITVSKDQYISWNTWISFDSKTIRRLSNLNLSIDIDTYIIGNEIK